jgi:hypothetical protein
MAVGTALKKATATVIVKATETEIAMALVKAAEMAIERAVQRAVRMAIAPIAPTVEVLTETPTAVATAMPSRVVRVAEIQMATPGRSREIREAS